MKRAASTMTVFGAVYGNDTRTRKLIAAWAGFFGTACFLVASGLGGLQFAHYSHISQTLSETYAAGTPWGAPLRFLLLSPSAVFFSVFSLLAVRELPGSRLATVGFYGVALFYGILVVVSYIFFPCDEGCPVETPHVSLSQWIHNAIALLCYIFLPLSLLTLGVAARTWERAAYVSFGGIIAGLISMTFMIVFLSEALPDFDGIFQRIVEASALSWISLCSLYLNRTAVG